MKKKLFVIFALCFVIAGFAEEKDFNANSSQNKGDFPIAALGDFVIHMKKITAASKGNTPAIEFELNSERKWELCEKGYSWGRDEKTYKYFEEVIPGTRIIFNITNKLNDVTYYKITGEHPYKLEIYDEKKEAEFLKRFVFFKFTATAAKGMSFFQRHLDNDLYALDTKTKLLYAFSLPTEYEWMIGNNYIPLNWQPFETSPKTKEAGLKFYEYDPIGFVTTDDSFELHGVKMNIHFYDWWLKAIIAGRRMKTVQKLRFMPQVDPKAEQDLTVRDAKIPLASPYRRK